jgi:hypothetical protein
MITNIVDNTIENMLIFSLKFFKFKIKLSLNDLFINKYPNKAKEVPTIYERK